MAHTDLRTDDDLPLAVPQPPRGRIRGAASSRRAALVRRIQKLDRRCCALDHQCCVLKEKATSAEHTQAELLSTLSHDLRNPLSVILASLRMLDRALPPDSQARRQVNALERAADEMNQILFDTSDAAQIERGQLAVRVAPEQVTALVERAVAATRSLADNKGVAVRTAIGGQINPVVCENERIVRVLTVLISNALRFTPKGGAITVHVEPDGDNTRFAVTDTGPGIDESRRAEVFARPFGAPRRSVGDGAAPRKRTTQGSGLALYVARRVVEAHGGRVGAETAVGRGSTLFFVLPAGEHPGDTEER